jgi:SAM-dependent methyltransferase
MRFVSECRMCAGKRLAPFLDLGATPPADQFLFEHQLAKPEESFPLKVLMCEDCGLAQLSVVVPPEVLYCNDYPYESSTTAAGRRHWDEFARTMIEGLGLQANDLVVDIGSNVGVLLQMFKNRGMRVIGIDPAANIADIANRNGIETISAFFSREAAQRALDLKGPASLITATNVFAHIDDLHAMLRAVDLLLADEGVFVVEAPYFLELLEKFEYDTIYHEHLSYLSLKPLVRFLDQFNMEVFTIQRRDIHGGSLRVLIQRKGSKRAVSNIVGDMIAIEKRERIFDLDYLERFARAVAKNRDDLRALLHDLKKNGRRIVGVSAPAKGMTLLNYCGLGRDLLDFITEKSKLKIGRYTPGGHIPVVSDDELLQHQPDYALLLAWNFADEIMNNLRPFAEKGGKYIIPIPHPQIVG